MSYFDPKIIGPGVWYTLHTLAKECDNGNTPGLFIKVLKIIVYTFKCEKCRFHAVNYIKKNQPEFLILSNRQPCSYYINQFHNTVNIRLGKPVYTHKESNRLYKTSKNCKSCELHDNNDRVTYLH
jgi:hypothetical protein